MYSAIPSAGMVLRSSRVLAVVRATESRHSMSVEFRDPDSGRYVLYRSQAAHSADCDLHPYEALPRRIFLDTSVVNTLVKHAEQIFEDQAPDAGMEPVLAEDVESLSHIFASGSRTPW